MALDPRDRRLYDRAMQYAQQRWRGSRADRDWVETLAVRNNPGATWPHLLRSRHLLEAERVPS